MEKYSRSSESPTRIIKTEEENKLIFLFKYNFLKKKAKLELIIVQNP